MSDHSASKTIVRQVLTNLLCLAIGAIVIRVFYLWAGSLESQSSDRGVPAFGLGLVYGSISLVASLPWISVAQFDAGLGAFPTLKLALKANLAIGVFSVAFFTLNVLLLVLGAMLLHGEDITPTLFVVADIRLLLFSLLLLVVLGVTTGTTQALALTITRFDSEEHLSLISNKAGVDACRSGVLPFRQRMRLFWTSIASTLPAIGVIALVILVPPDSVFEALLWLVPMSLALWFLGRAVAFLNTLRAPIIGWLRGPVSKSMSRRKGTTYYLDCDNSTLETDSKLWDAIKAGKCYRLWYVVLAGSMRGRRGAQHRPSDDHWWWYLGLGDCRAIAHERVKAARARALPHGVRL